MTPSQLATIAVRSFEPTVASFINEKAPKLFFAKYSTGQYGRIMLPLIRQLAPNAQLNGLSTDIALAITRAMEAKGYKFITGNGTVTFKKGE